METKATFAIAEVKSAETDNPNGEFEIVMSTESMDRDGESIVKGAFDPLPASIPVHAFHDFNDPVGRATPSYDDQGRLVGRGFFASTPRAQEMRQLVADGVIGHTSVGFMAAERKSQDDGPVQITGAELLEVSFVSVPSNRDAAVLLVKSYMKDAAAIVKVLNDADIEFLTMMLPHHEGAVEMARKYLDSDPGDAAVMDFARAIVTAQTSEISLMRRWLGASTDPATPAPETPANMAGKSPASDVVAAARIRARAALLSVTD